MKNVLFINHESWRTGAPLVLLSLLREIKRQNPNKKLYVLELKAGPISDEFKAVADVMTVDFSSRSGIKNILPQRLVSHLNYRHYIKWLQRSGFELIYANTIASIPTAVKIKKLLNVPILAHIHEMEYTFRQYGVKKEIIQQCDKFIAVSSPVVKTLNAYGIAFDKITVIPPFSDNLTAINSIDKSFRINGVKDGDFVVGLSGMGSWRKGTDLFPLIVKRFKEKYPNVKCKFVWVGYTDKAAIEYDAKMLNVWDYIILTGAVSNPMDYYNKFDIFVLTSREDPFPLVCMECAALAKPIILFDKGSGIVDLVRHGQSGLHVPYLDIYAMSDAIYTLYVDNKTKATLGNNLRNMLHASFEKDVSLNKIISFFR